MTAALPGLALGRHADTAPGPQARYPGRETIELAFTARLAWPAPRQPAVLLPGDAPGFSAGRWRRCWTASGPRSRASCSGHARHPALADRGRPAAGATARLGGRTGHHLAPRSCLRSPHRWRHRAGQLPNAGGYRPSGMRGSPDRRAGPAANSGLLRVNPETGKTKMVPPLTTLLHRLGCSLADCVSCGMSLAGELLLR